MARKKPKTKSGLSKSAWRACAGVNSSTGRVKRGWKATKTGCPKKAKSTKTRRRLRRRRRR